MRLCCVVEGAQRRGWSGFQTRLCVQMLLQPLLLWVRVLRDDAVMLQDGVILAHELLHLGHLTERQLAVAVRVGVLKGLLAIAEEGSIFEEGSISENPEAGEDLESP